MVPWRKVPYIYVMFLIIISTLLNHKGSESSSSFFSLISTSDKKEVSTSTLKRLKGIKEFSEVDSRNVVFRLSINKNTISRKKRKIFTYGRRLWLDRCKVSTSCLEFSALSIKSKNITFESWGWTWMTPVGIQMTKI